MREEKEHRHDFSRKPAVSRLFKFGRQSKKFPEEISIGLLRFDEMLEH